MIIQLPCIVCVHFGVAEDEMKGNWCFESCPDTALLGNRKELKDALFVYSFMMNMH